MMARARARRLQDDARWAEAAEFFYNKTGGEGGWGVPLNGELVVVDVLDERGRGEVCGEGGEGCA